MGHNTCKSMGRVLCVVRRYVYTQRNVYKAEREIPYDVIKYLHQFSLHLAMVLKINNFPANFVCRITTSTRLNTTLTMLLYVLNVSSNNIDYSVSTLHVIDYYPVNNNINNFTVSESDNVCGTD